MPCVNRLISIRITRCINRDSDELRKRKKCARDVIYLVRAEMGRKSARGPDRVFVFLLSLAYYAMFDQLMRCAKNRALKRYLLCHLTEKRKGNSETGRKGEREKGRGMKALNGSEAKRNSRGFRFVFDRLTAITFLIVTAVLSCA